MRLPSYLSFWPSPVSLFNIFAFVHLGPLRYVDEGFFFGEGSQGGAFTKVSSSLKLTAAGFGLRRVVRPVVVARSRPAYGASPALPAHPAVHVGTFAGAKTVF